MGKLQFLSEAGLERLRQNIRPNALHYTEEEPWVPAYFVGGNWALESNIDIPDEFELKVPTDGSVLHDLENAKTVFSALRHLTPTQAADERLWAYMTHVTCWQYMRGRWGAEHYSESPRFAEVIQERYFFMADRPRALIRNGLSRLWWYGYTTYDDTRSDPFELTGVLLKNLDVAQSILERGFSRSRAVAHSVLAVLLELERAGTPMYERDRVRELAKYLVQLGGVTIIDALPRPEVEKLVVAKATAIRGVEAAT